MEVHDDRSLLALQGPKATTVLQTLTSTDLSKLYFSHFTRIDVGGSKCWVTRTGCVLGGLGCVLGVYGVFGVGVCG